MKVLAVALLRKFGTVLLAGARVAATALFEGVADRLHHPVHFLDWVFWLLTEIVEIWRD